MPQITSEHLKIYQNYGGDIDRFLRRESKNNFLFDENGIVWGMITSALQDVELISKRLVSKGFAANALLKLKSNCDEAAYSDLTSRIPFYSAFQKIALILLSIRNKINDDTDFIRTRFKVSTEANTVVNQHIDNIKLCDFETLSRVSLDFGPTGTYQELSIDNGWANEYLELAERFDALNTEIHTKLPSVI